MTATTTACIPSAQPPPTTHTPAGGTNGSCHKIWRLSQNLGSAEGTAKPEQLSRPSTATAHPPILARVSITDLLFLCHKRFILWCPHSELQVLSSLKMSHRSLPRPGSVTRVRVCLISHLFSRAVKAHACIPPDSMRFKHTFKDGCVFKCFTGLGPLSRNHEKVGDKDRIRYSENPLPL